MRVSRAVECMGIPDCGFQMWVVTPTVETQVETLQMEWKREYTVVYRAGAPCWGATYNEA